MMNKNYCLICFSNLNNDLSFKSFSHINNKICDKCLLKFKVLHLKQIIDGIEYLFLYEYNNFFKKILYQYKGCYDIAIKDVFLERFLPEINIKYRNYVVVFPPSSDIDNYHRGFKHMLEIIKTTKLKYLDIFHKTHNYKQSSFSYKKRNNIKNIIRINKNVHLKNIKYLIMDDVFTSGSTIRALIGILMKNKVSKENIKVLVISKTIIDD